MLVRSLFDGDGLRTPICIKEFAIKETVWESMPQDIKKQGTEPTIKARIIVDNVELNLTTVPVSQDGGYRRAARYVSDRIFHYRKRYVGKNVIEEPRLMALLETAFLLERTSKQADHADVEERLAQLSGEAGRLVEQCRQFIEMLPPLPLKLR